MDDALVEVTQTDIDAGQRLLDRQHDMLRRQGAEVADATVKPDGMIVQAVAQARLAGVKDGLEMAAKHLEEEAMNYRHAQSNAKSNADRLYRMGQKDACHMEAVAIRSLGPRP